ncbi:MAG: tRNA lysidine(34) synthetase TilS [Candidatus Dormibacteraeota bacterium]|nr:tRNA lysidine(34) synthetase TilS [Candidatus Dormibacteraeota bacterium]
MADKDDPRPPLLPVAAALLDGRRSILVAVSGGPDSTALLLWLTQHALEAGWRLTAAHYDHALHPGSEVDAAHVACLCDHLGVNLVSERRRIPMPRGSVQAGAREARLEFLERVRGTADAEIIALAHTADDVVEGVILHLLRGSALAGLRGMPAVRGPIVRPLLWTWRAEVEDYLAVKRDQLGPGREPLRDPANADVVRFARARIRHRLLPELERQRPGLSRRLRRIADRAAAMQTEMETDAVALLTSGGGPTTNAQRSALANAARPVRWEAYRRMYAAHNPLPGLLRTHLEAMDRLTTTGSTGQSLDLPRRTRFRVEWGSVSMEKSAPVAPAESEAAATRLRTRPCPGCDEPGAAHLRPELVAKLSLGCRRPGLRLRPLGGRGSRKLQDILVDAHVPRHRRDALPLVFAGDVLAWVPGIAVDAEAAAVRGEPAVHVWLEYGKECAGEGPTEDPRGSPTEGWQSPTRPRERRTQRVGSPPPGYPEGVVKAR